MSIPSMLLFVVALPALVALVTALVAFWAGRCAGLAGAGPAAAALALGVGVLVAQLVNAPPAFPPIEVTDRIPGLVLAALLLGLCESIRPAPGWARGENRVLLGLLVLGVILGPVLGPDWPNRHALAGQGGLVLAWLIAWSSIETLAAGRSTAVLGPALLVVIGSTAAALLLSGNMVLFQIVVGLAAALGSVWVLSWWRQELSLHRGGVPVLVATLAALLIEGHVYGGLPLAAACLLGGAPLAAWLGFAGPARRLAPWQAAVVSTLAALVPAGVAVGLAFAASPGMGE